MKESKGLFHPCPIFVQVAVYEWTAERELRQECCYHNMVVALCVKTKDDFVLVRAFTLLSDTITTFHQGGSIIPNIIWVCLAILFGLVAFKWLRCCQLCQITGSFLPKINQGIVEGSLESTNLSPKIFHFHRYSS